VPRDYYEVLGVARDASSAEIKKAYRRLARQNHPDVARDDPTAAKRFKDIQQAYDILSDAKKRKQYDQFGHAAEQFGEGGPGAGGFRFDPGAFDFGGTGGKSAFGDILGELFGRGAGRGGREADPRQAGYRGTDVEVGLALNLEEVLDGTTRDVTVTVEDPCHHCSGRGLESNGRPCGACSAHGRVRRQQTLRGVKIPAGADDGSVIKARGKGGRGLNGPDGDVNLRIGWREHPFFRPAGDDLECEVPITLAEAAMGAEIPVPTLRGVRNLRIPPGTAGGTRFRIRDGGLPSLRTKATGSLLVKVKVVVPAAVNDEERRVVEAMSRRGGDVRADMWRPREQ